MDLHLSLEEPDPDLLRALHRWLQDEPELRGKVKMPSSPPLPGEMGGLMDAVTVAVGGGGAISVLAASLKVFFAQPRRSDVDIKITTPDGRKISVNAKRVADPEAIVHEVLGTGHAG